MTSPSRSVARRATAAGSRDPAQSNCATSKRRRSKSWSQGRSITRRPADRCPGSNGGASTVASRARIGIRPGICASDHERARLGARRALWRAGRAARELDQPPATLGRGWRERVLRRDQPVELAAGGVVDRHRDAAMHRFDPICDLAEVGVVNEKLDPLPRGHLGRPASRSACSSNSGNKITPHGRPPPPADRGAARESAARRRTGRSPATRASAMPGGPSGNGP